MTILIKRSGGFAGREERLAAIDTSELPTTIADRVRERIARLTALSAQEPSAGADRLQYEIEITEPGTGGRKLTVVDEGDPDDPAMKEVIAILESAGGKPW
ncbi:MAG: hypothetical protein LAP39_07670 [Acidobacteriia bacterium]|nr:hypothetical protein [Terriglobia bacterium]